MISVMIPVKNSKCLHTTLHSLAIQVSLYPRVYHSVTILDSSSSPVMGDRFVSEAAAMLEHLGVEIEYLYDRASNLPKARLKLLDRFVLSNGSSIGMFLDSDVAILNLSTIRQGIEMLKSQSTSFIAPVVINPTNQNNYSNYDISTPKTYEQIIKEESRPWVVQFKNLAGEARIEIAGMFGLLFSKTLAYKVMQNYDVTTALKTLIPREDMAFTRALCFENNNITGLISQHYSVAHYGATGMDGWNLQTNKKLEEAFIKATTYDDLYSILLNLM